MARLNLTLLGPLQMSFDHQMAKRFESHKATGLLAFLAVEHHRLHGRDTLAELLWPGQTIEAARSNFRRALANLRFVLGDRNPVPSYLIITREIVQFNLASDVTVDVVCFRELAKTPQTQPAWVDNLEHAVALYCGPFLDGFHLDDCPEFELWITSVRSDLERLAANALNDLARHYHSQDDLYRALPFYWRSLALDQYNEAAQRGLLAALATTGQRGVALKHYAAYCCELLDELRAAPESQTVELAEAIRRGNFQRPLLDFVQFTLHNTAFQRGD